jgi:hypothetical protein
MHMRRWAWVGCIVGAGLLAGRTARAEEAFDPGEQRAVRATTETLLGAGGALLGGVAFGAVGCAIDSPRGETRRGWGCLGGAVLGGVLGAAITAPIAVWATGTAFGANGGLGYTYLGELAGLGVGIPSAYFLSQIDAPGPLIALVAIGLPLAGSVIGYELSTEAKAGSASAGSPLAASRPLQLGYGFAF